MEEMMGFWVFMIVADMVMPLLMVIMGRVFVKHPPKTINNVYGYRTVLSRKNQQTWDYAHDCCGRLWQKTGLVMCLLTLLVALPVKDRGDTVVGWVLGIWVCLQCAVLILSVPAVERKLKKRFDGDGNLLV